MAWRLSDRLGSADLNDAAQVHHGYALANEAHYVEIVRNE
jgi:hypothetical protein